MPGAGRALALGLLAVGLGACGGGRIPVSLPAGAGTPLADPAGRFATVATGCEDVQSVVAESRVSGRVDSARIRATLLIGVERRGNARVEALAGPGGPVLVLTAQAGDATLVLPRDNEVVQGASARQLFEALVGVPIETADLAMALAGCFGVEGAPRRGRRHGRGVESFDFEGGSTVWTEGSSGRSHIAGGRRDAITVGYASGSSQAPSRLRLLVSRAGASGEAADLTLTLSSVRVNETIDPSAFVPRVPADARLVTLEALRQSGPLGGGARR